MFLVHSRTEESNGDIGSEGWRGLRKAVALAGYTRRLHGFETEGGGWNVPLALNWTGQLRWLLGRRGLVAGR